MSGKIVKVGTAVPDYSAHQNDILNFMGKAYNNDQDFRKLKILSHQSGIERRYSVIPDFGMKKDYTFFKPQQPQPDVQERMRVFKENALDLSLSSIQSALDASGVSVSEITHLITVTCTGLHAPGLGNEIVHRLKMKDDLFQTSVNFLGCNAAFHALKIADLIARDNENAKILVTSVELCTLHFQPKNNTDNLLSNTIFGDGAATALVTSKNDSRPGIEINGFYSLLLKEGYDYMGWNVLPQSFEMILNSQLPRLIGSEMETLMSRTIAYFNIKMDDIERWAVHPGGKKILEEVKKNLKIPDDKIAQSYEVLKEYGNMSSSTILYVLKKIMELPSRKDSKIMAIGFGPGLSIDTAMLTHVE